jgi:CxxC-x17-CxxC domain-containing protein
LPKRHPDQRHKERLSQRNPRKIYERNCAECMKNITTTFTPDRKEKIVCEECYRKLVY